MHRVRNNICSNLPYGLIRLPKNIIQKRQFPSMGIATNHHNARNAIAPTPNSSHPLIILPATLQLFSPSSTSNPRILSKRLLYSLQTHLISTKYFQVRSWRDRSQNLSIMFRRTVIILALFPKMYIGIVKSKQAT